MLPIKVCSGSPHAVIMVEQRRCALYVFTSSPLTLLSAFPSGQRWRLVWWWIIATNTLLNWVENIIIVSGTYFLFLFFNLFIKLIWLVYFCVFNKFCNNTTVIISERNEVEQLLPWQPEDQRQYESSHFNDTGNLCTKWDITTFLKGNISYLVSR